MPVGVSNTKLGQASAEAVGTQFKIFQRDVSLQPGNNPGAVLPVMAEQDVSNLLSDGWAVLHTYVERRTEGVENPHGIVYTIVLLLVK